MGRRDISEGVLLLEQLLAHQLAPGHFTPQWSVPQCWGLSQHSPSLQHTPQLLDEMAALIAENFRFLSLFFKSKDVMIFNGLVALGTVGSEELFSVVAFNCPCSPARNYIYGLAAIGVPALALFLIGVIWNNHTWNLVAECHKRGTKNFSAAATFLLFGSIMGRASVAPITWSVISLLRGEAYICALSEFVKPSSLDKFPSEYGAEVLAKFPCRDVPANLTKFRDEVTRRLRYESQVGTPGRKPQGVGKTTLPCPNAASLFSPSSLAGCSSASLRSWFSSPSA